MAFWMNVEAKMQRVQRNFFPIFLYVRKFILLSWIRYTTFRCIQHIRQWNIKWWKIPIDFYDSLRLRPSNLFSHSTQRNFSIAFVISIKEKSKKKRKKKVAMPTANYSITNTQLDLNVCYPSLCSPPNAISIRFIILSLVMLQKQSPHSVTFIFTLHYTTREAVTLMRWLVCVGSVQFGSVWYVGERYAFLYLKCTHT